MEDKHAGLIGGQFVARNTIRALANEGYPMVEDFEQRFETALASVPDEEYDRERFVPGHGPPDADVMLVGEAPGADEVEQGEPFVGSAGGRLDSILEDLGVDREELYVTNVVKVRPPENRTPRKGEIDAWMPVFEAELDAIDPDSIVPLGTTATRAVLGTSDGITDLRGTTQERDGRRVMPTFHPAATFYDTSKRPDLEADLERAFEAAGRLES